MKVIGRMAAMWSMTNDRGERIMEDGMVAMWLTADDHGGLADGMVAMVVDSGWNGTGKVKCVKAAQVSPQYWKPPICYDDDEECSIQMRDYYKNSPIAIASDSPIMDSLITEDEHFDTIPEMESDEVIKSSVEDLVQTLSESEDLFDIESECDEPICDNSLDFNKDSEIFSNPLFDYNDDFTSSDDESLSDEDVPKENFKIYSNPIFDEEIISNKIRITLMLNLI
ncbi:hypothetical protein Tco_0768519 [Tanacetum coccineum]